MPDIPHFALPFRFQGGSAVVVEQDSQEDVGLCVEVLVGTSVGSRIDEPEYGIVDPTFRVGLDQTAILDAIEEWEPRASAVLTEEPDRLDELVRRVQVRVETGSED